MNTEPNNDQLLSILQGAVKRFNCSIDLETLL
jgi:hypothetical protein